MHPQLLDLKHAASHSLSVWLLWPHRDLAAASAPATRNPYASVFMKLSIWQLLLHPSPLTTFPSSHSSVKKMSSPNHLTVLLACSTPLPHPLYGARSEQEQEEEQLWGAVPRDA